MFTVYHQMGCREDDSTPRWRQSSGTVEQALVMIPCIILFLSVLQIAAGALARASVGSVHQGSLSTASLLGAMSPGASSLASSSLSTSSAGGSVGTGIEIQPLPGGGNLLIRHQTSYLPRLTPLILNQDHFISTAISIDENS